MDFISVTWLGWIAVTTALYWAVPKRFRIEVVAPLTVFFLMLLEPISAAWLAALAAVTYFVTRGPRPEGRKAAMAIVPIAAVLLGYKVLSASQGDDLVSDTLIPLGLSYYTLRCIHYALERYKGTIRDLGFKEVIGYLFFLPTIFIGPIHRFGAWRRDSQNDFDLSLFGEGLERILHGWVKVAFLGNFVASIFLDDMIAEYTTEGSGAEQYLQMIQIGLNLYWQFAGFSDLAIGFAMLLGFRVMENFNWPFLQRNISAFWDNWHISLTSWSRDYVYSPTIARFRSPALGAVASLIAIALWHEVSVRYLLWGIYHGLGIVIWQRFRALRPKLPTVDAAWFRVGGRVLSVLVTVHFVMLSFLLVRQEGFSEMVDTLDVLFTEW